MKLYNGVSLFLGLHVHIYPTHQYIHVKALDGFSFLVVSLKPKDIQLSPCLLQGVPENMEVFSIYLILLSIYKVLISGCVYVAAPP